MNRRTVIVTAVFLAAGLAPRPVAAHKFHASLAEIEYNAKERRVEIALRLFVEDFEDALAKASGRRVRIDATPDVDQIALAYLKDHMSLVGQDGAALELRWVGKEARVDEVWVYVEAASDDGLAAVTVSDRVFFELFDDQVNTVNLRDGDRWTTLVFKPGDTPKKVAFPG